ncbi:MAG: gephyrin-like molybdotransferase Glp [Candidatus Bipolaricaulia bacterium]
MTTPARTDRRKTKTATSSKRATSGKEPTGKTKTPTSPVRAKVRTLKPVITPERAWTLIRKNISPLPRTRVPLEEAMGLALAEKVLSPQPMPPFTSSAMDGYALKSSDTRHTTSRKRTRLTLVQSIPAGTSSPMPIKRGQAARIFTGAPLPPGADAVLKQEEAVVEEGELIVSRPVRAGENVRRRGEELRRGAVALAAGAAITPASLGLLACLGMSRISVYRRACVSFFTTGAEVVDYRTKPAPGQVRDAHSLSVPALLRAAGAEVRAFGRSRDDKTAIGKKLECCLEASDLTVVAGGVSVGDFDLVKDDFEAVGGERIFWVVAMKPGKPLFFGRRGRKLIIGLPGNPAAVLVCSVLFVVPAVKALMGHSRPEPVRLRGRLSHPYLKETERREYARVRLKGDEEELMVEIPPSQGSHMLASFARADFLAELPEGKRIFARGTEVTLIPLPWGQVG